MYIPLCAIAALGEVKPRRHADWPQRLALYLQGREKSPFAWGANDCCTFAADAVIAMTGKDAMRALRGRYTSERGAARLIKQAGGLEPLVSRYLGEPLARIAMAGRGDVVLMPNPERGPCLAICVGTDAAAAGVEGTILFPMSVALAAWKV